MKTFYGVETWLDGKVYYVLLGQCKPMDVDYPVFPWLNEEHAKVFLKKLLDDNMIDAGRVIQFTPHPNYTPKERKRIPITLFTDR
jgi:hypothetical protein